MTLPVLRLEIEYDGAAFYGWAAQPGLRTVESVLTEALQVFWPRCGRPVVAGRTDTGVHASGQVVSLEGAEGGPELGRIPAALNAHLPPDVAVLSCRAGARRLPCALLGALAALRVPRAALARALAAARGTHLALAARPLRTTCSRPVRGAILGEHDFRAFTPAETQHQVFRRRVLAARWERARRRARCSASRPIRFSATWCARSSGRWSRRPPGSARPRPSARLLEGAERAEAGVTAPPQALCLVAVRYADAP